MSALPYREVTIATHRSKEEVHDRLLRASDQHRLGGKAEFYGVFKEASFKLVPRFAFTDSFKPIIKGNVAVSEDSTLVHLQFRPPLLTLFFTALLIIFGAALSITEIVRWAKGHPFHWTALLIVIIPYSLCMIFFSIDVNRSIQKIQRVLHQR